MLPQRPVDLRGDFHWPWWPSDPEGCRGWGSWAAPTLSPARARWQQECDTYTWCLTKDAGLCKHILWALL